jgi:hypothetical protein
MLNSGVVDVGLGLVLVYLILGLMCTTVHEWIAQFLKMRAKTLREGISVLLNNPAGDDRGLLRPEDIDAVKLVNRLTAPGEKLAAVLGVDASAIVGYRPQPDELMSAARVLASRLNAALNDPDLWQKIDVERVAPKTLERAQKPSSSTRLQSANLALLREAYPDEIAGLAQAFYNHSLIKSLSRPGSHPSYVPAHTFAMVLIDILGNSLQAPTPSEGGADSGGTDGKEKKLDDIKLSIAALPNGDIKRVLLTLMAAGDNQLSSFQRSLEAWFDDAMDRVSGWYKTRAQVVTVIVALGITIFANADTVKIAQTLFLSPVLRAAIARDVAVAGTRQTSEGPQEPPDLSAREKADLGELIGWSSEFQTFHFMKAEGKTQAEIESARNDDTFPGLDLIRDRGLLWRWLANVVPVHLLGWFLTGVAVSLGSPFWFDTLNRFMNIRAAGTAPNEKGQDRSKA